MAYPRHANEANDVAAGRHAMTDPEESRKGAGQTPGSDAAVDAVCRRGWQGTDPSRRVVVSDHLNNSGDGSREHSDEGSGTKRRPPELT